MGPFSLLYKKHVGQSRSWVNIMSHVLCGGDENKVSQVILTVNIMCLLLNVDVAYMQLQK